MILDEKRELEENPNPEEECSIQANTEFMLEKTQVAEYLDNFEFLNQKLKSLDPFVKFEVPSFQMVT